jgi:hypothetical protein
MNLDQLVETLIKEAQARGEFDNLPGKGRPIDLSAYFDTPEEVRNAYAMLKNAGMVPAEIELLQEIAALKERLIQTGEAGERNSIQREIRGKQLQFDLLMERQKRQRQGK